MSMKKGDDMQLKKLVNVKAILKKNCLNTGITRKGGAQPLPKCFLEDFFLWSSIFGHNGKGGGGKGIAQFGGILLVLYC